MSFVFFAALGGLLVTLAATAHLKSHETTRQTARVKAVARRRNSGFKGS